MRHRRSTGRHARKRPLWQLMFVLALVASLALPVMAAPGYLVDIPIDTVSTIDDDEFELLAQTSVPAEFQGQECTAVSSGNNSSVHPGNDLLVRSGGTEVRLSDVEAVAGPWVVNGVGTLVLGPVIEVWLDMGPDEFFSAGLVVTVECEGTPETGRIIVEKIVTSGSDAQQAFTFTADYDADGFTLSHGQSNDSGELDPGVYSVAETVPAGWSLVTATCDDQSPIGAIDLQAGETVTCTFSNDESPPESGEIIVEKVVLGTGSQVFEFTFNTTGFTLDDSTLAHGQSSSSGAVAPGAGYMVSETVPTGWTQVGAVCDDGSDPSAIDVSAGEVVTCTFTNSVEDDVGAAILVTVAGSCVVVDDEGEGVVSVTVSVADGATVVVTDSDGDLVGTFSQDGSITVPEGAVYNWSATANDGFEFPAGFATSGSVTIGTCSTPDVLPFTGVETDPLFALGIALLGAGLVVVTGGSYLFGWNDER